MGRSENGSDACPTGTSCPSDEQPEHDATVSDFYLDEYEVTVGRFRQFVQQYDGTPPTEGAGAHPQITGSGWKSAWNSSLPSSQGTLITNLKCSPSYQTWRDAVSTTEEHPINCVDWFQAFAFCAWDGGRLPTEAEWEYASAGGSENRLYPWGSAGPNNTLASYGCLYHGSSSCSFDDIAKVGALPAGAGRWGHQDLGGNMWEWVLDWFSASWYGGPGNTCDNCANLDTGTSRVIRSSYFDSLEINLRNTKRSYDTPTAGYRNVGFRCARTP